MYSVNSASLFKKLALGYVFLIINSCGLEVGQDQTKNNHNKSDYEKISNDSKLKDLARGLKLVVGEDTRKTLADDNLNEKVGYITDSKTFCSGFFISESEIITAIHCTPFFHENMPIQWEFINAIGSRYKPVSITQKWARADLVKIKLEPIDDSVLLPSSYFDIETISYNPNIESQVISYNSSTNSFVVSKSNTLSYIGYGGLFSHELDTSPGASGSAILQNGKVVGMHIGYFLAKDETDISNPITYASNIGVELSKVDSASIFPILRFIVNECSACGLGNSFQDHVVTPITDSIENNTESLSSWDNFSDAVSKISINDLEKAAGNGAEYISDRWNSFGDWVKGGCDGDYTKVFPSQEDQKNVKAACEKIVIAAFTCSDPTTYFDLAQTTLDRVKTLSTVSGGGSAFLLSFDSFTGGLLPGFEQSVIWAANCVAGWSLDSPKVHHTSPQISEAQKSQLFSKVVQMEKTIINENYGRPLSPGINNEPPIIYGVCGGLLSDKRDDLAIPAQNTRWGFNWGNNPATSFWYRDIRTQLALEDGRPNMDWCGIGDSIKFTGLYTYTERFEILERGIKNAFESNGQPHRSMYHKRIKELRGEPLRAFSKDMSVGFWGYLLSTGDRDLAEKYKGYVSSNGYWTCDRDLSIGYQDESCILPFYVRNIESQVFSKIGVNGYDRNATVFERYIDEELARQILGMDPSNIINVSAFGKSLKLPMPNFVRIFGSKITEGFVHHLTMTGIYFQAMADNGVSTRLTEATSFAASRFSDNLYFQYVNAVVNRQPPSVFESISMKLNTEMSNWKSGSVSKDSEWVFQRDPVESWRHVGADLVFLAKSLLGKHELTSRRESYVSHSIPELGVDAATATLLFERYRLINKGKKPNGIELMDMAAQYNTLLSLRPVEMFREFDRYMLENHCHFGTCDLNTAFEGYNISAALLIPILMSIE